MGEDLKTTLSNIPCGLCVYRLAGGKISPVYHNSVFYEIMGYAEEHIRLVEKETSFLGVHPEDLEPLKRSIQGAIRSNGTVQHTYRLWNDSRGEYRSDTHGDGIKPGYRKNAGYYQCDTGRGCHL